MSFSLKSGQFRTCALGALIFFVCVSVAHAQTNYDDPEGACPRGVACLRSSVLSGQGSLPPPVAWGSRAQVPAPVAPRAPQDLEPPRARTAAPLPRADVTPPPARPAPVLAPAPAPPPAPAPVLAPALQRPASASPPVVAPSLRVVPSGQPEVSRPPTEARSAAVLQRLEQLRAANAANAGRGGGNPVPAAGPAPAPVPAPAPLTAPAPTLAPARAQAQVLTAPPRPAAVENPSLRRPVQVQAPSVAQSTSSVVAPVAQVPRPAATRTAAAAPAPAPAPAPVPAPTARGDVRPEPVAPPPPAAAELPPPPPPPPSPTSPTASLASAARATGAGPTQPGARGQRAARVPAVVVEVSPSVTGVAPVELPEPTRNIALYMVMDRSFPMLNNYTDANYAKFAEATRLLAGFPWRGGVLTTSRGNLEVARHVVFDGDRLTTMPSEALDSTMITSDSSFLSLLVPEELRAYWRTFDIATAQGRLRNLPDNNRSEAANIQAMLFSSADTRHLPLAVINVLDRSTSGGSTRVPLNAYSWFLQNGYHEDVTKEILQRSDTVIFVVFSDRDVAMPFNTFDRREYTRVLQSLAPNKTVGIFVIGVDPRTRTEPGNEQSNPCLAEEVQGQGRALSLVGTPARSEIPGEGVNWRHLANGFVSICAASYVPLFEDIQRFAGDPSSVLPPILRPIEPRPARPQAPRPPRRPARGPLVSDAASGGASNLIRTN